MIRRACVGVRQPSIPSPGGTIDGLRRQGTWNGSREADLARRFGGSRCRLASAHETLGCVHGNANPMCTPALSYVAGCLAVVPRPPDRRCPTARRVARAANWQSAASQRRWTAFPRDTWTEYAILQVFHFVNQDEKAAKIRVREGGGHGGVKVWYEISARSGPLFPISRMNCEGDQHKKGQKSNPTAHDISSCTPNTVLVRPVCTSTRRIVDLIPEEFDHLQYFGM